jgi:hypothetical protein
MKQGEIYIRQEGAKLQLHLEIPLDLMVRKENEPQADKPAKGDPLIPIKQAPVIALVSRSTLDRMKKYGEISYVDVRGRIFFYESVLLSIRKERRLKGI